MKIPIMLLSIFSFLSFTNPEDYTVHTNSLISRYSKEVALSLANEVVLIGTGGELGHDVKTISLHFTLSKDIDLSEARRIYVTLIEILLKEMNSDKDIRPFLRDYPSTYRNTDVLIGMRNDKGQKPTEEGKLTLICNNGKGMVSYLVEDPINNRAIDFHDEPYEEALRIVNEEKAKQATSDTPDAKS